MTLWHIAMTLPSREPAVVSELRELGFMAVYPRIRRREVVGGSRRNWRGVDRVIVIESPVLPNYVFYAGPEWQRALDVDGLTLVLRMGGDRSKPATLALEDLVCVLADAPTSLLGPAGDGLIADPAQAQNIARAFRRFLEGQAVRVKSDLWRQDIAEGTVISQRGQRVAVELTSGKRAVVPAEMVEAIE